MNKKELRKYYLEKRKLLTSEEVEQLSIQITDQLIKNILLSNHEYIHIFLPIIEQNEINTFHLIEHIQTNCPNTKIVVPKIDSATTFKNCLYRTKTDLIKNKWGILEPLEEEIISSELITLCIVPLLCFDMSGHRVGYGKGFYDRFLANNPHIKTIGLSIIPPTDFYIPSEENDIALDLVITPTKTINTNTNN